MKTLISLVIFISTQLAVLLTGYSVQAQTNLTWDPGAAQNGTAVFTNNTGAAGSYLFEVTTQASGTGLWRSVLMVDAGEADLYISQNVGVDPDHYYQKSETPGGDTITTVLTAGQTWYILVEAEAGAQWRIFAGAAHIEALIWDPGAAQLGTEVFSNPTTDEGMYLFEVTTQADALALWRSVLKVDAGEADLYIHTSITLSTNYYNLKSDTAGSDTIVAPLTAGQTWYILVDADAGAQWSLFAGAVHMTDMAWDPGTADAGTAPEVNPDTVGGAYYYRLTTELPDLAAWRTALDVSGAEADLYIRQNALPYVNSGGQRYTDRSTRTGDDGFTRYLSNTSGAGQEWYILVLADDGANWNLISGDVYAADLGVLAADASSGSGLATIPPEEIRYFKTTIPSVTYAWRLWLQNAAGAATWNQPFYVRKGLVPHPSSTSYYDRTRTGQGLLVPAYLVPGDPAYYYVGVPGTPGAQFQLDSRQHEITDESYNSTLIGESASGFLYKTYRIPVPPEQIAWEVTVEPVGGTNPDMAIRLGQVPNEFNNDAFSEVNSTSASDSVTLVPTTLSDGSFYVTVYGTAAFTFNLRNREPIITQIDFNSSTLNNDPGRAGWRIFAVSNIPQQLGQLGWLLTLSNHVPGTEIAIRRNFVPGRWNYRQNGNISIYQTSHNDQSSTLGFLQDPDHEADVWYVGVYSPAAPLGAFTLDSGSHAPTEIMLDGHTNATRSLEPKSYHFYRVIVPEQLNGKEVLGWELRMTSWANERPYMLIRSDQLPEGTTTTPHWYPWQQSEWLSGKQWANRDHDWTGYRDAPGGQNYPQPLLSMGMGAPLQPGSYFIAFYNNSSAVTSSYSFASSAVGSGMTYDPQPLAFNGGSAVISALPARAVQYYKVTVPPAVPSWEIELENTSGETMLYLRENYVPTWQVSGTASTSPGLNFTSMTKLQKTDAEHYVLLPENGATEIPAGDYYLMVVSEGQSPATPMIGTGTSSAVLRSLGEASITDLGTLPLAGQLTRADSYEAGEIDLFEFDVPAGVLALEVRLEDEVGDPQLYLRTDALFPRGPGYGIYSGHTADFSNTRLITVPNPAPGTYSLTVGRGTIDPLAGSYTLRVVAVGATEIALDGGGDTAVVHPPNEWRYYHVDIPAQLGGEDVLGWELRVTNWTGQNPHMVVRRDLAPEGVNTPWYYPRSFTSWPSGNQWAQSGGDWSKYTQDSSGTQSYPKYVFSMGMDRPLTPGSYYIGFYNSHSTTTGSFSFVSSAIGNGMSYDPQPVAFSGGSAVISSLPARDVAYFEVEVPAGQTSWEIQLENTVAETMLYVRKGYVPTWSMNTGPTYSPDASIATMTMLQKTGDEHFVMLPASGQTLIPAGIYYLMAVSEGLDPESSRIGTGSSSAVLRSHGAATVTDLGTLPVAGVAAHVDSYDAGEVDLFRFTVPAGVLAMEIRLDDRVGSPELNLRLDGNLPSGSSYGSYSGYGYNETDPSIITLANPAPGTWSLMVNDSRTESTLESGAYTLRIITSGTTDIVFDGGGDTAAILPPGSWNYYKVEVPAQIGGQDVLGWELRTTEWSGYRPHMVVRRDQLPEGIGTPWYYPRSFTYWPSGNQWSTSSGDWTGYIYDPPSNHQYPQYLLSMGMDRPLSPGTYYIGFYNNSSTVTGSYSFVSRAIGNGMSYDPQPVAFNGGSAVISALPARDVAYFEIDVPVDTANWRLKLENTSGETELFVREGHVPTWHMYQDANYSPGVNISWMPRLQKAGDEHYLLLPESGETRIPAGRYYLMVVSEGQAPSGSYVGTGTSSAILHSLGAEVVPSLGSLPPGDSLEQLNSYDAGEVHPYRFDIPSGIQAVKMRLENVVGAPEMNLRLDGNLPSGLNYGLYSGYGYQYFNSSIITIPNAPSGTWSMVIGDLNAAYALANGSYRLVVEDNSPVDLNIDAVLNTNGNSNVANGVLADNQRDYYHVEVPEYLGTEPVVGWYLTTTVTQGLAQVRVRKELLPTDSGGSSQTPFDSPAQVVVPGLLTPGTWYVEVKGVGATGYTLTSSAVWTERDWTMPALGEPLSTPGLPVPLFGDSGVNEAGLPLPIDQGIDLENGFYHFYSVTVPEDNAGLMRTQLEAISGNPNLYIRAGFVPTIDHQLNNKALFDHRLDSTANTEYGSWVPYDGRYVSALEAGTWYIMVKADGASNARYRLKLSGGNAYVGGNVQELALDGGSVTGQLLADDDWRHYRVEIPTNAPANWNITYSQESGNVDLYIRDTVPAGNSGTFSDHYSYIRDWNNDRKNEGTPRPYFENVGTHTLNMPPLRPGHVYYLSFIAKSDASFSVSSGVSGGTIPDYERVDFETGFVSTNIPAFSEITYQVEMPPDAVRWIHSTTNTSALNVYLEQGTLPSKTYQDHAYWLNGNGARNQYLLNPSGWPWRPGYTYYFTVVNPGATPEPFVLVMKGSTAAEIPQNLTATDGVYDDYVRVNWSSISGVSTYEVWRNTADDKAAASNLVSGLTSSGYDDYSAVPGTLYYYWASVGGVTNRAWFSNSNGGWVPGFGSISPSQRVHSATGGVGTITVTAPAGTLWNATESPPWVTINSGSPGTHNGTVVYTVGVYAGETARTGTITVANQIFTVIQSAFGVPSNVQASDGTFADRTEITWDVLPGATRYYLYRNEVNNTAGAGYLGNVTTNLFNDLGGIENRTYFYFVRPYNAGGQGGYSLSDTGWRGFGGMTQEWIDQYFPGGYPGDLVDSDGDFFNNYEEFVAGSNPTNAQSFLRITAQYPVPGGLAIEWLPSVAGRWYMVNWTDALTNSFQTLETGISFPQNSCTDAVHAAESAGFYEVGVELK